jgi:single-strand DNA-binding protein
MASFNKVFLMGNLTRDPEVRQTSGGSTLCTFSLAVNRQYTTGQGEEREETSFIDVEVWGRQAESCGTYLQKGRPALVEGRLKQDRWEDRETGASRSKLLVQAERVQFLGAPRSTEQGGGPAPVQSGRGPQPRTEAPAMPEFEPVEQNDDNIPF